MTNKSVLLPVGLFVTGFLLLAAVLHLLVPSPLDLHADMRSEKLVLLRQWHGRARAAAFGSSHIANGFDPRSFDAVADAVPSAFPAASPGSRSLHSLNLAVPGGAQTEQRSLALRFVRQLEPAQVPPLVRLELNAGANLTNDHLVHPRAINLYDWSTLRFAWSLGSPRLGATQTWGRRMYAVAAATLYNLNLGMLSSRIFSAPLDDERLASQTAEDRRGLEVEHITSGKAPDTGRMVAGQTWKLQQEKGVLVPANRILAEDLQRASAVPGLRVAYVVTPRIDNPDHYTVWPPCLQTAGGAVPIFALDRPSDDPGFFRDATNWFDDSHLTEKGAAIASRRLAAQWNAWQAHPGTACED